jgi:hypothetical protein
VARVIASGILLPCEMRQQTVRPHPLCAAPSLKTVVYVCHVSSGYHRQATCKHARCLGCRSIQGEQPSRKTVVSVCWTGLAWCARRTPVRSAASDSSDAAMTASDSDAAAMRQRSPQRRSADCRGSPALAGQRTPAMFLRMTARTHGLSLLCFVAGPLDRNKP